jgi:hypothetical protein
MSNSDPPVAMAHKIGLDDGDSEDRLSTVSSGPDDAFFPLSTWI